MLSHLEEHAGCGCVAPVMHLAAPEGFVFVFVYKQSSIVPDIKDICICIDNNIDNQMTTEFLYPIAVTANNNNEINQRHDVSNNNNNKTKMNKTTTKCQNSITGRSHPQLLQIQENHSSIRIPASRF